MTSILVLRLQLNVITRKQEAHQTMRALCTTLLLVLTTSSLLLGSSVAEALRPVRDAPPPPFCPGNSGQYKWTQQQHGGFAPSNETFNWFMSPSGWARWARRPTR